MVKAEEARESIEALEAEFAAVRSKLRRFCLETRQHRAFILLGALGDRRTLHTRCIAETNPMWQLLTKTGTH